MSECRDRKGNVLQVGDRVECVQASQVRTTYPGQPGEVFTVAEVMGTGTHYGSALRLEGHDHTVDAARFVKVVKADTVDPTCDRPGHMSSSCDHAPDAEADGYSWGDGESILQEAHQAVYGDRGADYGHPREHWTRTAVLWTGLLQGKLADGEYVTPEDVGRLYIADKLSRDVNSPKRDNRVDMAGYALCLDRLETGK